MFVRTKNDIGILEGNEILIDGNWYLKSDIEYDIIDQADTIEELCEAIVYYDCVLECVQVTWLKGKNVANFKRYFDYVKTGHIKDVKGAILTNKGLIYVAKLNDKGELELI